MTTKNFQSKVQMLVEDTPEGWWKAFGGDMLKDFYKAWEHLDDEQKEEFNFLQVKEKFGELRIYICPCTSEMNEICHKYETQSRAICINCGRPATKVSTDYILPFCDDCAKAVKSEKFTEISVFYGEDKAKKKKGGKR